MTKIATISITHQGSGVMNEDVMIVGKHTFGLFDGASSLTKYISPEGLTAGKLAADICARGFSDEPHNLLDTAIQANSNLRNAQLDAGIDMSKKEELWSTSASVVRISNTHLDYIKIADSPILVLFEDGTYKKLGEDVEHDLETIRLWQKVGKEGIDPWESIQEQAVKTRRLVNITYGSLNGEPEAIAHIQRGNIPLAGVTAVIILSDGLLLPKKDPAQEERWSEFVDLYQSKSLEGIYARVRGLENEDPYALHYPRLKKHDDASAIAIEFRKGKN